MKTKNHLATEANFKTKGPKPKSTAPRLCVNRESLNQKQTKEEEWKCHILEETAKVLCN